MHDLFANFLASPMSEQYFESAQNLINIVISAQPETASTGGTVTSEGVAPKVVSMEVPAPVPNASRLPRPKPTPSREVPKWKKYKKNKMLPV